eukprot:3534219-Pyramimonas_sp.AAC.1
MGDDPQVHGWAQPVYQWDPRISRDVLQKAWQRQIFRALRSTKLRGQVAGATRAMLPPLRAMGR